MTSKKNASSTIKAVKDGRTVYLSARDEERGYDIEMDYLGWSLEAI